MLIQENDFKIKFESNIYTLYLKKNKKELKEDSEDLFRIGGYFNCIDSALKQVILFRKDKKYSFGEEYHQFAINVFTQIHLRRNLKILCKSIYNPIIELKHKLFVYDK